MEIYGWKIDIGYRKFLLTSTCMSQNDQKCAPNPDITGLGVRIAIYTHVMLIVLLSILSFFEFRFRRHVTPKDGLFRRLNIHILFLSSALMLCALIRALTVGLSVYHMLIVLNLSWINAFALSLLDSANRNLTSLWRLGIVGHLIVQSSLGIWLWVTVSTFGHKSGCDAKGIDYILFGHVIPATNQGLRIASIVIYGYQLVLSFYLISRHFSSYPNEFLSRPTLLVASYLVTAIIAACAMIVFIVDTELMVHKNRGLFDPSEQSWTLGQVLAMLLLLPPIYIFAIETGNAIRKPEQSPSVDLFEDSVVCQPCFMQLLTKTERYICLYSYHPLNPYPLGHGLKLWSMGFEGVWVLRELPKIENFCKNIFGLLSSVVRTMLVK
jgi:hypothetical protein